VNVLLLGEYSGFYQHLKRGLEEIGCRVTTASSGDSWKSIDRDVNLGGPGGSTFHRVERKLMPYLMAPKLANFDVVQAISPFVVYQTGLPNKNFLRYLRRANKKLYFSASGDDPNY
jgi:hypothetical protein